MKRVRYLQELEPKLGEPSVIDSKAAVQGRVPIDVENPQRSFRQRVHSIT